MTVTPSPMQITRHAVADEGRLPDAGFAEQGHVTPAVASQNRKDLIVDVGLAYGQVIHIYSGSSRDRVGKFA